ncbi:hypothetical protein MUA04_03000 [Enterobacteriaceae bacterium H11S18]|uniref:hypothetical protein n=1 Tax=Dryocola clanedunensis TaxID=2925396 RepID=UPI0022F08658|nr:hypothetical protein [Dryocola clanedunensis]MCT4709167.1 hypothetical protein [Dryocola clanedunensis]
MKATPGYFPSLPEDVLKLICSSGIFPSHPSQNFHFADFTFKSDGYEISGIITKIEEESGSTVQAP